MLILSKIAEQIVAMAQFYVKYEVRCINAIGIFYDKSDIIEAENPEKAREAFIEKYKEVYDFRSLIVCKEIISFTPTHRHLNIQTGDWEKCEFVRYHGPCDAIVRKADGLLWHVGRPFLEKINAN